MKPFERMRAVFRGSDGWAAFLTCILVALIVVVPLSVVLSLAVNEANSFYHSEQRSGLLEKGSVVATSLPFLDTVFQNGKGLERLSGSFQEIGKGAIGILGAAYQSVVGFVLWLFVLFFSLFYFLIDGRRMVGYLMRISPLRDEHEKLLFQKFISISRATLKGTLIVGIIQGALGGVAFAIAGVPSPIIWGIFMAILSLIPMVGAGLIWLPTGIILLLSGSVWQGVFLLLFGLGVISVIDNILRPKLVGRDTEMHPLLVFFATLGGIALFGIPGFLIGPIIVSLFMALAGIYMSEYSADLKEYNDNGKV
jgi:predicted PurR-regulated permease PerM